MQDATYIRWFSSLGRDDVATVGGKTASLGELYSVLAAKGVRVPNGFAQATQWNGSSSLTRRRDACQAATSSWGLSEITFSGQVAAQSPHCTQARSAMEHARAAARRASTDPVRSARVGDVVDVRERLLNDYTTTWGIVELFGDKILDVPYYGLMKAELDGMQVLAKLRENGAAEPTPVRAIGYRLTEPGQSAP